MTLVLEGFGEGTKEEMVSLAYPVLEQALEDIANRCIDSSARLIEPTQGLRAGDQIERAGAHRLLERINIGDR